MTTFALLSLLVTAGALFSLLSFRVLRLPTTVGTMLLSMAAAVLLIIVGNWDPYLQRSAQHVVAGINFNAVVLHGMLALLLFAGALQLDLEHLSNQRGPVLVLSVVATALSTAFVAGLFFLAMKLIHLHVSLIASLLFGALISPTDPIAVLDMLRRAGAPPALEVQLAGESLFNDGVGAVIFLSLLGASAGGRLPSLSAFGGLLILQAGGGIALGAVLGYLSYRLLRYVDGYRVEVMLTLALAMGGYALADALKISAPLEVVTAGILVSGRARSLAMSDVTREHVDRFWELIDDLMNVILFLLLGIELLVMPFTWMHILAGFIAVPIVLMARLASVGASAGGLALCRKHIPGSIAILTWGGLRGGLAVALALGLPSSLGIDRNLLLVVTFVVVVFSILVQGLTLNRLLRRIQLTQSRVS